jgi:hypothetical protein
MKDESKPSSQQSAHDEAMDVIDNEEAESINLALELINHKDFEVLLIKKFQSNNSFV